MSSLLDVLTRAKDEEQFVEKRTFSGETLADFCGEKLDFSLVTFEKCRFVACDFSHASFINVTMYGCDFSNCCFKDSYWKECAIQHCKADGADFENATLRQTGINETPCRYINLTHALLDHCFMSVCDLRECAFSEVKLRQSKFVDVDFRQSNFFKTPLKGCDLSSCNVDGILLSDTFVELKGARISAEQAPYIASLLGVIIE